MGIDLDKLKDDYLKKLDEKNPNLENDPIISMQNTTAKIAAQVCISILKEYEKLKNSQDL